MDLRRGLDCSDTQDMSLEIKPGMRCVLVAYKLGDPHFCTAKIESTDPFNLSIEGKNLRLEVGQRIMVVVQDNTEPVKAQAVVESVADTSITLSSLQWEDVDRRRFPRFTVNTGVEIKTISEGENGPEVILFKGTTMDVSLGGTWILGEQPASSGSLVETRLTLNGHTAKVLGLIAWTNDEQLGFGVEFLDFVGDARYRLHEFLSGKAA
ncbi:MAG TPA: PilZ domain-containing protein [Fimbriimonadaceae bacterium]|nr:PilZ domain-containing protein [Fimbriimonadaceae bacterium]